MLSFESASGSTIMLSWPLEFGEMESLGEKPRGGTALGLVSGVPTGEELKDGHVPVNTC